MPHRAPAPVVVRAADESAAPGLGYQPGQVIAGKYQLVSLMAQGGMSAVWVVQNLVLDAQFALKMLRHNAADAQATERMLHEAQSAARTEHPNIIKVFDFGVTDAGDPFLVMELLSGTSLKDLLEQRGRLPPIEAVRLLLPVADALAAAHAVGILHRDIKPDNIVCVTDSVGRVCPKIVEFGIATRLGPESLRITQTGFVLGSPEYMSPERVQGRADIDNRTDVWSYCVVLFELLTGRTPFQREDDITALMHAIVDDPAPPLASFGVADLELGEIIARGLRKLPAGRWRDMRSLGRALALWLLRHGVREDAYGQSLRMAWLGTSSSYPPVALDARPEALSIPAAARSPSFDEPYEPPRWSFIRSVSGIAAAALLLAGLVGGGLYSADVFPLPSAAAPPAAEMAADEPLAVPARIEAIAAPMNHETEAAAETADASTTSAGEDANRDAGPARPRRAARRSTRAPVTLPGAAPSPKDETLLPELRPPPELGSPANPPSGDDSTTKTPYDEPEDDVIETPYDEPEPPKKNPMRDPGF